MVEKERVNGKDTGKLVSIDSDLNNKAKLYNENRLQKGAYRSRMK